MPAKAPPPLAFDQEPIVLPKATRPLTPAHIALLKLIAERIVDEFEREMEGHP